MRLAIVVLALMFSAIMCQAAVFETNGESTDVSGIGFPDQAGLENQPAAENIPAPFDATSQTGQEENTRIYFLSLQSSENEAQLTLNEISVIEGGAPDYRSGGDWWFQLINEQQQVIEEGYFQYSGVICEDSIDQEGQWIGRCYPGDTPLTLEIPYHPEGTDITVYDNTGTVRFGPYDVRGM